MRLIRIEVDENDYHYAGHGTMPTMPMWLLGRQASWTRTRGGYVAGWLHDPQTQGGRTPTKGFKRG